MAVGSDDLIEDVENCHTHLVNNYSVSSFISEKNELTVTRSFGDRKYSTMCFKPSEQNTVDIVITQGEYSIDKPTLHFRDIGSGDLRKEYSTKAKLGVAFVFLMLIVMVVFVILVLLSVPGNNKTGASGTSSNMGSNTGSTADTTVFLHSNLTSQSTESDHSTDLSNQNLTDAPFTANSNSTLEERDRKYKK